MPKLPIGDISPCVVVWDYSGTPLHITPYKGTIALRWTDAIQNVEEEGFGDAPVDAVFSGSTVELDVPMARSTLMKLASMLAMREEMGELSPSGKVLTLRNIAGCDMYASAKDIVIAPICNNAPNPDPNSWTHLFKCHPWRDFELTFDRSGQRIHLVKFKVFPNQDSGFKGDYGTEGMETGSPPLPDFS